MFDQSLQPIVPWLDEQSLRSVYSSQYWNDLEAERTKEWWIAEGSEPAFARLRAHLEESGLLAGYRVAEQYIARLPRNDLAIADLAAGIGWTSSLLSRLPNVAAVNAVEISQHRLELLFPQAVRMLQGEAGKLRRNLGSFYDMKFAGRSMDIVFVSSAFHHASSPLRLLTEIDRVLRPGGSLILIGENFVSAAAFARRALRKTLQQRKFCWNFYELFPPDDASGDHYYRMSDYYLFLQMLGYRVVEVSVQKNELATFIAEKITA